MNLSKGFIIQDDFIVGLVESGLAPKDIGTLVIAAVCYRNGADLPKMDRAVKVVWNTSFKKFLDADMAKYDNVCERNKANAQKRWSKAKETEEVPNDTSGIPNDASDANIKYQISNIKDIIETPKSTKARPLSAEEVADYRAGLGYRGFDAQKFYDYYETNGWVQGKGKPIKDWKARVRNWQRNSKDFAPKSESWLDFATKGI